MDENERKELAINRGAPMSESKRTELEELVAIKLLEVVSNDDLEQVYFDVQKEWAETLPDEELEQTARDLGIVF